MAIDRSTSRDDIVTDLSPVFKLIEEPKFAELYATLRDGPATIPDLLPELSIEKSTAYNYIDHLERGGLVSEVGTSDGSARYRAEEFRVTIHISEKDIEVTPELALVIAQRTVNSEVDRFIEQYGVATLGEFVPLAQKYAAGEMTYRAIAEILNISRAAAFDMLREILAILDIVPDSTHSQPGDHSDEAIETIIEDARSSE